MLINCRNKGYTSIISFVYIGKEEIHEYVQYEISITIYMGRIENQKGVPKWLPFEHHMLKALTI